MLTQGVPFPAFAEQMKAKYVAEAEVRPGGKPTDSRLSVLTGLQRRDIARLRGQPAKPRPRTHLARVVALWQSDSKYIDDTGTPKVLPRAGDAPSFDALAWEVRRDVHPRTLLDTLVAAGTVEIEDDHVRLVQPSYQPAAGSDDQLAYLGNNVGDHLAAAIDNVEGRNPRLFERALHVDGLRTEDVATLHAEFSAAQMILLERLRARASEMKARGGQGARQRFRAGGYVYTTEEEPPQ